ncbi:hypothetical protein JYB87_08985 [Shewanella avicenniae]|uniref:Uncharacterized protein n=1 Tax=Shewanella avicenniae TaxID=2814294 RepID=A0ABX7QWF2_9GAMM|nr:hypothetical protein [Shewanella avicenniae]QSX35305.1 hypothetical protein JYB87_08985 [Shewanella avicenniae]
MNNDLDLQSAIAALDEYGYDKKLSTDLEQARNKPQMMRYLKSMDYSIRRMKILQDAVNSVVEEMEQDLLKQEQVQTFKTKVINLSRELNLSYDEVLRLMTATK